MKLQSLKILIVDDDEDDYLLTSDLLKQLPFWNVEIDWSSNFDHALLRINHIKYDLFFFDYLLGSHTGLDLINSVKKYQSGPVILMTGKADEEIAINALRKGAADYIVKENFNIDSLTRSIRYSLERDQVIVDLKRNERLYKTIFDESRDILFITSLDGEIITINGAFLRVIGSNIINGNRISILNILEKGFIKEWDNFLKSTEPIKELEVRFYTSKGERRVALFSAKREYYFDGQVDVHCRLHDVTLQRQTERENLFSEKLAATGRLVRMLAHEIRNPLTNVNLAVEQLEEELEEIDTFYTEIIKRNCARINSLISQLVETSNPTEMPLVHESIHETLESGLLQSQDRIQLYKIRVIKEYANTDLVIAQNQATLGIAFSNLFTNAIEAMEPKNGILTIRTRLLTNGVEVKIIDNGCGISQDKMGHVFEPYFTGKKTGMGIGLATTLSILQSHNGRIDVESELGMGTVFTLTFPLVNSST